MLNFCLKIWYARLCDFFQADPAVRYAKPSPPEAPASPPAGSQFSPPSDEEIRTIYVPLENAINVPQHYQLSLGTSFGYKDKDKRRLRNRNRARKTGKGATSYQVRKKMDFLV